MVSRIFTQELATILTNNLSGSATVFVYDGNAIETLPAVIVGVTDEERYQDTGLFGNYVLNAYIAVHTNGYDDQGNDVAEDLTNQIFAILKAGHVISVLDGLFHEGNERIDADDSTTIVMKFKVYTFRLV